MPSPSACVSTPRVWHIAMPSGESGIHPISATNILILFIVKISNALRADDCVSLSARCNLDTDQLPSARKPVIDGVEFAMFGHSLRPVSRITMRTFPTSIFGHVADAAFVCIRGTRYSALQQLSPDRSFTSVVSARTENVLSRQQSQTSLSRTKLPLLSSVQMSAIGKASKMIFLFFTDMTGYG